MTNTNKILVIGSSNTDMTVVSENLPRPGETVLGGKFSMGQGGKGANQAIAATRLGGDVSLVCKVGDDLFGSNAINHYKSEGLNVSSVIVSDKPTGVALIFVDSTGENCISVASGANGDMTKADIDAISDKFSEFGILLLQLEIPVDVVLEAARMASAAGVYVVLNPAPARELPQEIFQYISLFIPNQTETALYTGINVVDSDSAEMAVKEFRKIGIKDVIITMGSKGSMVAESDFCEFVPACNVKAIDTTAAGDTYCGALCVALSERKSLVEAARFATKASSITVQRSGAQSSIPYRKEICQD